jgi:hypothetical protein
VGFAGVKLLKPVHGELIILQYYQKVSYCRHLHGILLSGRMKDVIFIIYHLLTTVAKLLRPGGSRAIIAENLLLKHMHHLASVCMANCKFAYGFNA